MEKIRNVTKRPLLFFAVWSVLFTLTGNVACFRTDRGNAPSSSATRDNEGSSRDLNQSSQGTGISRTQESGDNYGAVHNPTEPAKGAPAQPERANKPVESQPAE